jgi:hypothetical protein
VIIPQCLLPSSWELLTPSTRAHGTLNYTVTQLRITNRTNSSHKGLIGYPSTSSSPGLKFARFSRFSRNLTPLPLRFGDALSRAMPTVTGFPFADPRTHSIQHKTGQNRRKNKSKSKSCSVDHMVLVEMSVGVGMMVCKRWRLDV